MTSISNIAPKYIFIQQDEAYFGIEDPRTEAEIKADEIIGAYNMQKYHASQEAYNQFPLVPVFGSDTIIGDVDNNTRINVEMMKGFSYSRVDGVEKWETPIGTLTAKFEKAVGEYLNKFSFVVD